MNPLIIILFLFMQNTDFLESQRNYPRVRNAELQKLEQVKQIFNQKGISFPPKNIFIRAFKYEQKLQLWARSSKTDTFSIVKTYDFCSTSGELGPKRKQGDYQIPEGFYYIDRFNPSSNFHLSLGINYPNKSDQILGKKGRLGGDIFIHGDCVTIGCIPITDEMIKELYIIAVYTRDNGQVKIPVHIFPIKMTKQNMQKLQSLNSKNTDFWNNLRATYSYFEEQHLVPKISVNKSTGEYILSE